MTSLKENETGLWISKNMVLKELLHKETGFKQTGDLMEKETCAEIKDFLSEREGKVRRLKIGKVEKKSPV